MKKTLLFTLLFVAILGINSCTKEVVSQENEDFIGVWSSDFTEIYIGAFGSGTYKREKNGTSLSIEGTVKITSEYIKFNGGIATKKLSIDQRPSFNLLTGMETMVLEGETFYQY